MKVVQLGNLGNVAFNYAKYLRKAGIECDLLVPTNTTNKENAWEGENHSWIKFWDHKNPLTTLFKLRELTKSYDIIHAHAGLTMYAPFLNKPYIAHSMGSDLRIVAMKNNLAGIILRMGYRKANMVFFFPDQLQITKKLGFQSSAYVPQIIDTEKYKPIKSKSNNKLIFFHPSHHIWNIKGNDIFIRAFAKFIEINPNVELITVYWGSDRLRSKELINKLNISDKVKFVGVVNKEELIKLYNKSDVVVDQFIVGSFGLISLEAMSCGKPLLQYIDKKTHLAFYDEMPPIFNARTEKEILRELIRAQDPIIRKKLGLNSRDFILKYHDWKPIVRKLIFYYENILGGIDGYNNKKGC